MSKSRLRDLIGVVQSSYYYGRQLKAIRLKSYQLKTHKYKHTDDTYNNILAHNFSLSAPNQVWITDVTYIRIKGSWHYLAVVLDLYVRRVVRFVVSGSPHSMLTAEYLQTACHIRLKSISTLFHSDQATHYISKKFAESLAECDGMTQNMSCCGDCLYNATTERLFKNFKTEWTPKGNYENISADKSVIITYI